jgi:hypothetical protein
MHNSIHPSWHVEAQLQKPEIHPEKKGDGGDLPQVSSKVATESFCQNLDFPQLQMSITGSE